MSKSDLDESKDFTPRFDANGLIPVVTTDAGDGRLLMLAYMNDAALRKTIETGEGWYWSRSRQAFWRKGETSGHTQKVVEIRTDCDMDAIQLIVEQKGAACHTGRRSCFYRIVETPEGLKLTFTE